MYGLFHKVLLLLRLGGLPCAEGLEEQEAAPAPWLARIISKLRGARRLTLAAAGSSSWPLQGSSWRPKSPPGVALSRGALLCSHSSQMLALP